MKKLASDLWMGLRTGPARAALAFFSLALGWFAVTVLLSTLEALQRQAQELVDSFGADSFVLLHAAGSPPDAAWNRRQVEYLRGNLADAAWVSGVKILPFSAAGDVAVVTVDADWARARGWRFPEGRAIDDLDVRQGARVAMVSAEQGRRNRWAVGESVLLGQEPFRVIGWVEVPGSLLASISDSAVYIPYSADVLETGDEVALCRVDALLFCAREGLSPEGVRRRVEALLGQPGMGLDGVEWITPESLLAGIRSWQRAIAWTAGVGGGLGLLLGAVTLAGMLLTGVRERIPEIGLRRALGAKRVEIAGLFVAESLALTLGSTVVGTVAAEGILRWLGGSFPLPFHFGAGTWLLPFVLACGLALLCSVGPAWMASRLPPAEALRNE